MKKTLTIFIFLSALFQAQEIYASECKLTDQWQDLCPILENRVTQQSAKMKLQRADMEYFEEFINSKKYEFTEVYQLKQILPKTSVELIRSVGFRGVDYNQAELIAKYLQNLVKTCEFGNIATFDNNTSHIIGRQWHEIDYSGEEMTWQKQKEKYAKYGIINFNTIENIEKFFPVESRLPYFNKLYKPKNCKL
jgi:hypothetical protein